MLRMLGLSGVPVQNAVQLMLLMLGCVGLFSNTLSR